MTVDNRKLWLGVSNFQLKSVLLYKILANENYSPCLGDILVKAFVEDIIYETMIWT